MLEVQGLVKHFSLSGRRTIHAVNGVSFRTEENEVLGIVGESGCGKSTLGRLILRLLEPNQGKVFFRGTELTALDRKALHEKRRDMQMVFQNPFASFNPKIRLDKALIEVSRYYGMSLDESRERIAKLFADTGLSDDLLLRWSRELSGGQLQRLAIVRALLSEPSLIIADEPLSALDVSIQAQLLNLLKALLKNGSMTMVFISHDMSVVEYFCNKVAVMYAGMIMEFLSADDLSGASSGGKSRALHPYTISLRAAAPRIDALSENNTGADNRKHFIIKGETPNPLVVHKGCPFVARCPEAARLPEAGKRCSEELPEYREVSPGHWVRCWAV